MQFFPPKKVVQKKEKMCYHLPQYHILFWFWQDLFRYFLFLSNRYRDTFNARPLDGLWPSPEQKHVELAVNRYLFSYIPLFSSFYYSISLLTVQYFAPMLIISVAYARIAFRLWGSRPPGVAQDDRDHNILVNKKKVSTDLYRLIFY